MKFILFILIPLAFSIAEAKPKKAAAAPAPAAPKSHFKAVCKNMTPQAWKTNYDGCMTAFAPGIQAKQITQQKSAGICNCVANGLVKESTCKDIERFQKDKAFETEMTSRLAKKCIPKEGGSKAPASTGKKKK